MKYYIALYLLAINVIAFAVYGIDKLKAKHNRWRTPESTLILLAAFGGSVGAFVAMRLFRHKTKHPKFNICIPMFIIIHVAITAYLILR
ncbi:MAG: DUF1294 domain-containing protein [Ruminococcus sp.]|nr:DUF1294 domain-containing protein [Ruminococcus sp.]